MLASDRAICAATEQGQAKSALTWQGLTWLSFESCWTNIHVHNQVFPHLMPGFCSGFVLGTIIRPAVCSSCCWHGYSVELHLQLQILQTSLGRWRSSVKSCKRWDLFRSMHAMCKKCCQWWYTWPYDTMHEAWLPHKDKVTCFHASCCCFMLVITEGSVDCAFTVTTVANTV